MIVNVKISVPKNFTKKNIKTSIEIGSGLTVKSIKMPLKPGAGRRRGNKWELDFCKQLSLWWSKGKDNGIFKRAGSTHSVSNGHVYGDVYAVKPSGFPLTDKIAIELKVVKETRIESANLLCGSSKMFADFWKQTVRQAKLGSRIPVLVVKIDRHCTIIFNLFSTTGFIKLDDVYGAIPICGLGDWLDTSLKDFNNIVK